MAKFFITALDPKTRKHHRLVYDNQTSELVDDGGRAVVTEVAVGDRDRVAVVSFESPGKKTSPKTLKISLGLSCNYECEYCSQRFVPRADETNHEDITSFLADLDSWVKEMPQRVEFWGGEPLVYIKTLRPLAEALRAKWPDVSFSMITNGSILTPEINEWIDRLGFSVGLSHDGPGQHVRGPDPLANPETKAAILDLYQRLAPSGRMSFNTMMNRQNTSRAAVQQFFIDLTGDRDVRIGEGGIVDAYDEGGMANSLLHSEFSAYRNQAFGELRVGAASNFGNITEKVVNFVNSLRTRRPLTAVGQRCGMDKQDAIAVDLRGNVLTCQNVSAVGVAPNGSSHKIGHVSQLDKVALTTATHHSHRDECPKCPVVQICQGACMFLEGALWERTCDNAYSDAIPVFAAGIEFLSGMVPIHIEGPHRADRHDIWGQQAQTPAQRRIIPINKVAA